MVSKLDYRANLLDRQAIAEAILVLVNAARKRKNPKDMEMFAWEAIYKVCRAVDQYAQFASQAAKEDVEKMGKTLAWLFDRRYGKAKGLQFEHVYLISDVTDEILSLPNPTVESVEIILAKLTVCWITEKEERRLPYVSPQAPYPRRPDPWKTYAHAEIVVLNKAGEVVQAVHLG